MLMVNLAICRLRARGKNRRDLSRRPGADAVRRPRHSDLPRRAKKFQANSQGQRGFFAKLNIAKKPGKKGERSLDW
jgi:hypothetical protein